MGLDPSANAMAWFAMLKCECGASSDDGDILVASGDDKVRYIVHGTAPRLAESWYP